MFVTAPTGAAAYNVRGSTIHRKFKINVKDIPSYNKMSDNTKKELMKKLLHTIALLFDERSMIGLMLLGQTENNVKETVYNVGQKTLFFLGSLVLFQRNNPAVFVKHQVALGQIPPGFICR